MLKGQASKFTDSESTGDLINKLLDTVATAASGPLYGVDQARHGTRVSACMATEWLLARVCRLVGTFCMSASPAACGLN